MHGPALTSSNPENNQTFDYLRQVWDKLEPSETKGSIAEEAAKKKDIQDATNKVLADDISSNGSDDDMFDLFQ